MTDNQSQSEQTKSGHGGSEVQSNQDHPGRLLMEARKRLGLSMAEVAIELGLTEGSIRHLETEQFHRFFGEIYVKGYLKNYARLLGLSEEEVLAAFARFNQQNVKIGKPKKTSEDNLTAPRSPIKVPPSASSRRIRFWTILLFVTGLLLVGWMMAVTLIL